MNNVALSYFYSRVYSIIITCNQVHYYHLIIVSVLQFEMHQTKCNHNGTNKLINKHARLLVRISHGQMHKFQRELKFIIKATNGACNNSAKMRRIVLRRCSIKRRSFTRVYT